MRSSEQAHLDKVMQPVERAQGLPNEFYVDRDLFEREKSAVFFSGWTAIGFAKDVREPGDALPVDLLGQPLLIVHGRDGGIRVFQNTCRHRGMILVAEKTRLRGAIRCPYHSWCYDHDGALKTTPHVGGPGNNIHDAIDRSTLGLIEIRSHIWRDIIFVNMSGDAPAFEDHAAALIGRWAEFEKPLHHAGADSSIRFELDTNWKLAVENFCESYHLPWVHPGLNSYSRLEDHYNIEEPGHFSGQGTLVYRPMINENGDRFPDFPDLGDKWEAGAEYIALFPNVLLGVHRDHAFAIILQPLSNERTVEQVEIYYADEAITGSEWSQMRAANTELWKTVFEEDIFVVEGMQKGRHGAKFDGGRFSPVMDSPTHLFHHWVAGRFAASKSG
ncbi:aromatic ring-hydroxylating dioxygenase subunit alpha [Nitratireductor sp. XY-223]|uniref:aromatic ring-hydroxylating oxygenase subunit alpha n=1 Tax=Nitratireductor sp. XY-223 TaxID=2561926 RepID=UPI0010A9D853|nr:aromatic ring-hydroxylating dioxygenase subunit alpha [Nitratireductor sp. XY-223]